MQIFDDDTKNGSMELTFKIVIEQFFFSLSTYIVYYLINKVT